MKIHEYQAKDLFAQHGIPVPRGRVAQSGKEARSAMESLATPLAVVKAQVHAGGRGKGGGIRLVKSPVEAERAADEILTRPLVTAQTGPAGRRVRRVLVEEGLEIARELYFALTLDRAVEKPVLLVSTEGGVEIEEVAKRAPEKIQRIHPSGADGLAPFEARSCYFRLGLDRAGAGAFTKFACAAARLWFELDASLVEVNPLVVTKKGGFVALDAKITFDDNALDRHPEIAALRDVEEEDPIEVRASQHDLSYVRLDGSIGCMVNGAGLAMATMDMIQYAGGQPANFLDVGGTATADRVREAMKIILSDDKVRAILINIFGGIVKCDVVAEGILSAVQELSLDDRGGAPPSHRQHEVREANLAPAAPLAGVPLVIRLEGTNVERARELLSKSGLKITTANGLADAAARVVALAGGIKK